MFGHPAIQGQIRGNSVVNDLATKVTNYLSHTGSLQTLAKADKLTITAERIDGGKLRCTGATWSDPVVILEGEALALENIKRQVLPSAPRRRQAPRGVPAWHDRAVLVPVVPAGRPRPGDHRAAGCPPRGQVITA